MRGCDAIHPCRTLNLWGGSLQLSNAPWLPADRPKIGIMKRPQVDPPRVAFIVETSMEYGRQILRGVTHYLREIGPWTVYLEARSRRDPLPTWLKDWDGDGILTRLSPTRARRLFRAGIPTVDLDDHASGVDGPAVRSDREAIGVMGAEHLLERGFRQFAYFGYPHYEWSRVCRAGYVARVQAEGYPCRVYQSSKRLGADQAPTTWEEEVDDVATWLGGLPKPLGLMACNDFRGVQALDACRRAGLSVPEEVAVIGVDNESLACELAHPLLSSVIPDAYRIGYEAAAMLDLLMKGGAPPESLLLVPPTGVVTRQSTDVNAIGDPMIAEAMRFIREHACNGIRIEDVVEQIPTSRSVLQRRFRAVTGRSIHDAIAAVRLQRVKQLLVETDLPLAVVSERAGFAHVQYLCTAFRQATGTTPGVYRRDHTRPP